SGSGTGGAGGRAGLVRDHRGPALGEHALAFAPGADQRDLDAEVLLDELDVPACRRRKPGDLVHLVERLLPPWQRLVDGLAVVEVGLVRGELVRLAAVP